MNKTRREFLKASAAFGAFNLIPAKVLWGATAPSNQLTRALIGFGVIAHSENHLPFQGSRLVGLTDCYQPRIDAGIAAAAEAGWGKVKGYRNFLELLDDPGVDIVHICTPPHWHGVQSVMAAKAGKDVWCEKPMTRTVGEGKRVKEVIAETKRMYRINTWFRYQGTFYGFGTPVEPIRQIVENGLLGDGPIRCVFGEGQGFTWKFGWSGRVQDTAQEIPAGLDWDMWLGPAPLKPYTDHRFGTSFRGYWDYDSGGLGDMAQHYLDPLQYLLCKDDTSPVKIDYTGLKQHPEAVGSFDRFTLTYADGTEVILDGDVSLRDEPLLRGSNGLCVYKKAKEGQTLRIKDANGWWPEEKVLATLASLPKPKAQQTDFIDSCRTRTPFALNESTSFRSSSMFNLAIVAWRLGRGFEFDPDTLHAKNDEAAERLLYQDDMMREPWRREMFG